MGVETILGKITIPVERPRVSRHRLLAALKESLRTCSSTVVSGRAGAGKTLLAAEFARGCGRRAAWYKVEAPDVKLQSFLHYLVTSVARALPGFGSSTSALGAMPPAGAGPEDRADAYVDDLQRWGESFLLVVDDLHLVYDADWVVPFFRRLLPLLPAEVHLLILGRGLPPAPLWRLRSKQRLCLIDEPALAFTRAEAEELFGSYGLGAEAAGRGWAETRGRAAALDARARRAVRSEVSA